MVNYCKSQRSLVGKTVIVTGANAGLGYDTALEFAKRGGRVILACRNPDRGNTAREKIVEATGNEDVIFKAIDLASFDSVRKFAKDFIETEERLDILVNNAGAMVGQQTTADGVEIAMQVNYFSTFLLTHLLLDLLKKSSPSRIVNVSSGAARLATNFDLDKLNEFPGEWRMYFKTKLCQVFFTIELAKRLEGSGVTVYSLHPGLGYVTALEFAKRGGRVILACRNPGRGNAACEKIIQATGNENVVMKVIDMSSLNSVRDFASDINETEERLDILVNNAGALLKKKTTADGLEMAMQVNHLSPFLLTHLLLDLLKKSTPSRIVNLSSTAAALAYGFDVDKLNEHKGQFPMYCKTKLCNIFFTQELARRLEGSGVTVYSVHPGAVHTEFAANMPLLNWAAEKLFLTPEEGAQTQIYCSLEDGIEAHTGRHFENCRPVPTYCTARDEKKAKQLWEVSENAVDITS